MSINTAEKNLEKILFVDDEESILAIAREFFRQKGYQVVTAKNGLEAIDMLKENTIDCCITDINMPEMDGLELAEHIAADDNTIPIIMMTGYPSLDHTIRTMKNGVVDFLIKPVNLNQMEMCVRRVFNQRRLFVENLLLKKEVESKKTLERLNKELVVKIDEVKILNKILSNFTSMGTTTDVFKRLVDMTIEITRSDDARFYVINEDVKRPFEVARSTGEREQNSDQKVVNIPLDSVETSEEKKFNKLIMEIATDEIPLLITNNTGAQGCPADMCSIIMVPLKIRDKVFGVLVSAIKENDERYTEKDLYYLSFMSQNAANSIENLALYENIYENLFATLYAFVNAIEARDRYTRHHSNRVTQICIMIGKALGCTSEEIEILNFSGHLHDIGKIGIRDDILLKHGSLTKQEFEKIKEHPIIGANIVKQMGLWEKERQVIRWHHECYDGSGYPDGLTKDEIPLLARIMTLADVYDAITSDRTYRKEMPEEQALQIIHEGSGTKFDPEIVDTFLKLYHEGKFVPITGSDPDGQKIYTSA